MLVAVLNGPNLNLLGRREPEIYGTHTLADIERAVRTEAGRLGLEIEWFQSNHEGALIDAVHQLDGRAAGALVNAAAWTHTSLALRDAMLAVRVPFVEVHLSNVFAREAERRHSLLADLAIGVVAGFGMQSYLLALQALAQRLRVADRQEARLAGVRAAGQALGLDALLIQHLPNIRYLTGFTGSAALLLVTGDAAILFSDFRYATQAEQEVGKAVRVEIDSVSVWDRLKRVIGELELATLGYEAHIATVRDLERFAPVRSRLLPTSDIVEKLRAAKSPDEIAAIRAALLADEALDEVLPRIKVGQSEYEVGAELEASLRRRGSEWHPFPTIVASGPRSALPHARTSQRVLGAGDWLLLDFGAQLDGYCADLTRTFVVGARADDRQRAVYEIVLRAQERAITQGRAGIPARQLDALARDFIVEHGFGDAFGHSLGHGLGLEVHEAPRVSAQAEDLLPRDAVVTVEPGIYFPGWGGVRLEEDVHLGADGAVLLSRGASELIELT